MKKKYSLCFLIFITIFSFFYPKVYGQNGIIETIYFKSNSFIIEKKYYKTLDLLANKLGSDTFSFLRIFGYADKKGSENYNDVLSGKRAKAVYDFLATRVKIDTTNLYVTWIGKSGQDVAYDLHFPSANIQKRCVDIWITFYRKPKK